MDGPKAVSLAKLSWALTTRIEAMGRLWDMQSYGGSSDFACLESVLGADWPGSVQLCVT